jgi:hypothetical protein
MKIHKRVRNWKKNELRHRKSNEEESNGGINGGQADEEGDVNQRVCPDVRRGAIGASAVLSHKNVLFVEKDREGFQGSEEEEGGGERKIASTLDGALHVPSCVVEETAQHEPHNEAQPCPNHKQLGGARDNYQVAAAQNEQLLQGGVGKIGASATVSIGGRESRQGFSLAVVVVMQVCELLRLPSTLLFIHNLQEEFGQVGELVVVVVAAAVHTYTIIEYDTVHNKYVATYVEEKEDIRRSSAKY